MRTFISLELPKEIKTEIDKTQKELAKVGVQGRWVKPEISHLTLAFLGSIKPEQIETINPLLEKIAQEIKPISLHFLKLGCFPNPAKARIIFVDLGGEIGKLHALALKIGKGLAKEKIAFDSKPFVSHITLGRIKNRQNLTQKVQKVKIKRLKFVAKKVSLNKSQLTRSGPIYEPLGCVSLA